MGEKTTKRKKKKEKRKGKARWPRGCGGHHFPIESSCLAVRNISMLMRHLEKGKIQKQSEEASNVAS